MPSVVSVRIFPGNFPAAHNRLTQGSDKRCHSHPASRSVSLHYGKDCAILKSYGEYMRVFWVQNGSQRPLETRNVSGLLSHSAPRGQLGAKTQFQWESRCQMMNPRNKTWQLIVTRMDTRVEHWTVIICADYECREEFGKGQGSAGQLVFPGLIVTLLWECHQKPKIDTTPS